MAKNWSISLILFHSGSDLKRLLFKKQVFLSFAWKNFVVTGLADAVHFCTSSATKQKIAAKFLYEVLGNLDIPTIIDSIIGTLNPQDYVVNFS